MQLAQPFHSPLPAMPSENQPAGYDEYRGNIKKIGDLIDDVQVCMMATRRADGTLISRPMRWLTKDTFDGTLWFFTYRESRKVEDVQQDAHVNLGFLSNDQTIAVSVRGTAQQVDDRAKIEELWQPELNAWFPDGKDSETLTLLRVDAHGAEYWDGTQNPIELVLGLAQGILSDKPADIGENEKLRIDSSEA